MKRRAVMFILILVCTVLQCSVFEIFSYASIRPNLLIILTVSFGLMRGKRSGMLTGFCCGFLTDLFFESVIGLNALLYLWVGYFSGFFYRIFYDDDIKTPIFLISITDLVYGIVQYILMFLLRGRLQFFYYLGRIIIPEVIYTLLVTIVFYQIFYHINKRVSITEKRSAGNIV